MAAKKIEIKFDIDNKAVQIAGAETMKLTQQVRLLKAELASGKYSQEEFEILSTKLGDVQDQMKKTTTRSGDLFTSLQLIPGPIGEIASKFNGAIALLKTFSSFSLADLSFQFQETLQDIKEIGVFLGRVTGITKLYTILNNALAASFVRLGIAEQSAAVGARVFAAALVATGIGALVVLVGLLVEAFMDLAFSEDEAAAASKRLQTQLAATEEVLSLNLASAARRQKLTLANLKKAGADEKTIREQGLKDLKENLGLTEEALAESIVNEKNARDASVEDFKAAVSARVKLEQQRLNLINDISTTEINNEVATNKERESQRQANIQKKKAADAEELRLEQEKIRQLEEAQKIQTEAQLSLLDNTDREILERTTRFEDEKAKLLAAGYKDLTALKKEFDLDIAAIDTKAKEDELAREKQQLQDIKDARKADQEAYFERTQEVFKEESDALFRRFGQSQKFVEQQSALIIKQEEDLKFSFERKLINQDQYTEAVKNLANQRIELGNLEADAKLNDLDLVANALNGFAQLAGENTKLGKALAIATTLIDTYVGAQRAFNSQLTLTPDSPIRAALAAAAATLAGLARVNAIRQTQIPSINPQGQDQSNNGPIRVNAGRNQGGFVYGEGGSITDSIPTMLSDGEFVMNAKSSALFSPLLNSMNSMGNLPNTSLPQAVGNQSLIDVVSQSMNQKPIRTYVTAQDMSNQQQFDRTIKSRSLI